VHQAVAGLAGDGGDVAFESRMVDRVHAHRDPRFGRGASASSTTSAACSASPPTGAPSSQSSVTSKTQAPNSCVISACSCRLLRMRASTPL
jgi:hypothetical protein